MVNNKKFLKKIICNILIIAFFILIVLNVLDYKFFQIDAGSLFSAMKNNSIYLNWLCLDVINFYLYVVLTERLVIKKKSNFFNFIILGFFKLINIILILTYFEISSKYRFVLDSGNISKSKLLLGNQLFLFDIIFSIIWYCLIKFISRKEKNDKTYILERMYKIIRNCIWLLQCFLIVMFMIAYDKYVIDIYRNISDGKLYGNNNYMLEMLIFWTIIILILVITFLSISKRVRKIKNNVNSNKYKDKELVIYYNPLIVSIPLEFQIELLKGINLRKMEEMDLHFVKDNYLVEDNCSVLVDYRLIENNVINISKFKSVSHVFEYNISAQRNIEKSYISKFINLIEICEKNNENYLIVNSSCFEFEDEYITKEVKNKYYHSYIVDRFNWYKALNLIDKYVDKEINNIVNNISDNKSCEYIKETLMVLQESSNNVEKFYQFIKIGEYMIHYEALYNISINKLYEDKIGTRKIFRNPTLGDWNEFQLEDDKSYNIVKYYYIELSKILNNTVPNKIKLLNLKQIITDIHNQNLGHGSISYYISKQYNKNLVQILKVLIEEFDKKNLDLHDKIILDSNGDEIPLVVKFENDEYIYADICHGIKEYICYSNGKIIKRYKENAKSFILDLGEDEIV